MSQGVASVWGEQRTCALRSIRVGDSQAIEDALGEDIAAAQLVRQDQAESRRRYWEGRLVSQ